MAARAKNRIIVCLACGAEIHAHSNQKYCTNIICQRKRDLENKRRISAADKAWREKRNHERAMAREAALREHPEDAPHSYRVFGDFGDWRRGAVFDAIEVTCMLKMGHLTPGMILVKKTARYRVVGAECYPQELVKV